MVPQTDNNTSKYAAKSLVCEACWNGSPFSIDAFQLMRAAKDDTQSSGYTYTTTWESIRASTAKGCNWCKIFKGKNKQGSLTITCALLPGSGGFTPIGTKRMVVYSLSAGSFVSSKSSFHLYTTDADIASGDIVGRDRTLTLTSPSTYKLALDSLNKCLQFHSRCEKPQPCSLPDRVIDCSEVERPKVFITHGMKGTYASLSYIWGGPQSFTTTHNIGEYINHGLDMQNIPRTIRDAVVAVHNFGIRYLWIDAFCILQDSVEDKNKQIGQMHRIYQNAYITLIAASAMKSSEGFLQDRPARVPDAHIPYRCSDGQVGTVYLANERVEGYDATRGYHDELEPVNSRGWCFQERLLSPRCFIYASDTLKYHCQTETVNIGNALCEPITGLRLPKDNDDATLSRRAWLFMIWEYTRRDLTVPGDRLIAFGGIAEQFSHVWGGRYLAGLWEDTLIEDLLWEQQFQSRVARPDIYLAPSWSWASVLGHITAPNFETRTASGTDIGRCEILQCGVTLESEEAPFGAVARGHLKLNAHVHEGSLIFDDPSKGQLSLKVQVPRDDSANRGGELIELGSRMDSHYESSAAVGEIWLIPLMWDKRNSFADGLIVVAANEEQFRRVGCFHARYGKLESYWVEMRTKRVVTII
ncbi:heterokaryon incompatibility protein-domain-containing protein [Crucibulum laeve]|uniref:Heterokaryon incompatibility protein-domain-containing protein n=1 Tax=Crucibulum laeve TaxID=68775 RepID=A0A5C3LMH5_9AGAR|nr:heterokaryon incompatibility protein-domain-containing protein [Crucibulum laeve]